MNDSAPLTPETLPAALPGTDVATQSVPPPVRAFGGHAAIGLIANFTAAIISRFAAVATQVVLAWYLTKYDYGVAGIALSGAMFISVAREFGIVQMLSRHPKAFDRWATDAFWLSTTLGLIGGLTVVIATPFVAAKTQAPAVIGPMLLLALVYIIAPPAAVPGTKMRLDLRFVLVAQLNTWLQLGVAVLSVALAIAGTGVYAIVLPILITTVVRLVITFWLAPVPLRRKISLSRWKVMLGSGWRVCVAAILIMVVTQGDNLILGVYQDELRVGVYAFAWQLTAQLQMQLGESLSGVLLPIFGHIRTDRARQRDAFVRCCRIVCVLGLPLFFLQAALTEPLLRGLWREKWLEAIAPVMLLSIGMGFRLLTTISTPLMFSQGRLSQYLSFSAAAAVLFVIMMRLVAPLDPTWAVPLAVSLFYVVHEVAFTAMALVDQHYGFGRRRAVRDVASMLAGPLAIGLVVGGTTWPLSRFVQNDVGAFPAIVVGGLWGVLLQGLLMFWFQRQQLIEVADRLAAALPRLRRFADLVRPVSPL